MAKNIEMQYYSGSAYEICYPKTLSTQVIMADSTTLEATITSLKTSVSEGKSAIASAITNKGVSTASTATFSTMATNIGKISTLSTDTSDATATAAKIFSGYTAYVKGSKITGTYVAPATNTKNWYTTTKTFSGSSMQDEWSVSGIGFTPTSCYVLAASTSSSSQYAYYSLVSGQCVNSTSGYYYWINSSSADYFYSAKMTVSYGTTSKITLSGNGCFYQGVTYRVIFTKS